MSTFFQDFLLSVQNSSLLEWVAVITGIISVWFSKKENVLVYPIGLVNTSIYVYISLDAHLAGEGAVNFYYTVMNIYGWYWWTRKNEVTHKPVLKITWCNKPELTKIIAAFAGLYLLIFLSLTYIQKAFWPGAIPWADALASAAAFTAMYLMTKKKVESWIGWIITNIVSIPLYFVKDYSLTSVYYLILLVLAFSGLMEWKRKAEQNHV